MNKRKISLIDEAEMNLEIVEKLIDYFLSSEENKLSENESYNLILALGDRRRNLKDKIKILKEGEI